MAVVCIRTSCCSMSLCVKLLVPCSLDFEPDFSCISVFLQVTCDVFS